MLDNSFTNELRDIHNALGIEYFDAIVIEFATRYGSTEGLSADITDAKRRFNDAANEVIRRSDIRQGSGNAINDPRDCTGTRCYCPSGRHVAPSIEPND